MIFFPLFYYCLSFFPLSSLCRKKGKFDYTAGFVGTVVVGGGGEGVQGQVAAPLPPPSPSLINRYSRGGGEGEERE